MGYQGSDGFERGPREMHKATCAECNKECEVPFKPSGDRPVYCRDCFQKRKKEGR
jgi:CxxC-x17-CxxC domain-containing protein